MWNVYYIHVVLEYYTIRFFVQYKLQTPYK